MKSLQCVNCFSETAMKSNGEPKEPPEKYNLFILHASPVVSEETLMSQTVLRPVKKSKSAISKLTS